MITATNRLISVTRGDADSFPVNLIGYEMEVGEKLILNVRKTPSPESPLIFSSVNGNTDIRINRQDTINADVGMYSAQLFLQRNNGDQIQIWPKMRGNPSTENLENFYIMAEVAGVE